MAEALEAGNQRGQPWADQAANGDVLRQRRLVGPFAVDAPVFRARVLLNGQLRRLDIDLLDDQSRGVPSAGPPENDQMAPPELPRSFP
jgi:hypothetical protein